LLVWWQIDCGFFETGDLLIKEKSMEEKKEMLEEKTLTRRSLLSGAGKIAVVGAGIAAVSGGLSLFSKAEAKETPVVKPPWPWAKLDRKEVGEEGWKGWYGDFDKVGYYTGCAYGVVSAIVTPYQKKMGEKYYFPLETLSSLRAGMMGGGGVCSALIGANLVFGLFAGPKVADVMLVDIMHWYSITPMPSFIPEKPKADPKSKTTADSIMCHASVLKFMTKESEASGKKIGFMTQPRPERCARLTADVAIKVMEMLDEWAKEGKYIAKYASPLKTFGVPVPSGNCTVCHGTTIPPIPTAPK
jgi:hypothetical protein